MSRLPVPGKDENVWGDVLNDFLLKSHTETGELRPNSIEVGHLKDGLINETKLDSSLVEKLNSHGLTGPAGPVGPQGEQGPEGQPGTPGVVVLNTNDPDPSPVLDGILYIRLTGEVVDSLPPTLPTGVSVVAVTSTSIQVSWSPSSDNIGVINYQVRVNNGSPFTTASTTHTFNSLLASTEYSITVRAGDAAGNWSNWSAPMSATTSAVSGALLFSDDFNRADGPAGNDWTSHQGGSAVAIVSNALAGTWGYSYGYAFHGGLPKRASVRMTFKSAIDKYQGIFLGYNATSQTGIKFFHLEGSWVIGNSVNWDTNNIPVNFSQTPTQPITKLQLDFDGTDVRAYINDMLVYSLPYTALGFNLHTDTGDVYNAGYCGEGKAPYIDSFEVYEI